MQLPSSWVMVRLSAMGDVALTTGVLDYWHATKGLTFTVVTREAYAPLFEHHPAVSSVWGLTENDLPVARLLSLFKNFARRHQGEGLLDLHGTPRSRLLSLLWHGPVRRFPKFAMQRRVFLASKGHVFQETLLRYTVPQRYALALEDEAPSRADLQPRLFLTEHEKKEAATLLSSLEYCQSQPNDGLVKADSLHEQADSLHGQANSLQTQANSVLTQGDGLDARAGTALVALHPYATHSHKAWHKDAWFTLMDLLDAAGIAWFIVGRGVPLMHKRHKEAGASQPRCRQPLTGLGGRDLTNATTLRETCALLQASTVLVTGDSGPMHLAAAVGTPVVALFGPTSEAWGFFPQGKDDVVMQMPLDCRPCSLHGKQNCGYRHACMSLISPQQVLDAVRNVLQKKQATGF